MPEIERQLTVDAVDAPITLWYSDFRTEGAEFEAKVRLCLLLFRPLFFNDMIKIMHTSRN